MVDTCHPIFVHLPKANITIDLTFVALVEWNYAPENYPEDYVTTMHLGNKQNIILTRADARILWQSIQAYMRSTQPQQVQQQSQQTTQHHPTAPATQTNLDGKLRA